MQIKVGCDLSTFKEYYKTCGRGEIGEIEEEIIIDDPSHCILWTEGQVILGHVLWHECSTSEHRKGDPRDKTDREILESLFGQNKQLIELHEVWLTKQFRGKGYGKKIFEYLEGYLLKRGFKNIVYYADHPAALTICRNRDYKEAINEEHNWCVFGKSFEQRTTSPHTKI
ncbi:MAG: GNAT family N-acetyltransferase [Candidatus Hodarchaeales archaeon]|jgi:GNAT superfamily N-acetyltransferase